MLTQVAVFKGTEFRVAQLKAIVQPCFSGNFGRRLIKSHNRTFPLLAYVELFKPMPCNEPQYRYVNENKNSAPCMVSPFPPGDGHLMHKFTRECNSKGQRKGVFVSLAAIWRPVQLLPDFGMECPANWNAGNTLELSRHFLLNVYDTRHTFQIFKHEYY